MKTETRPKPYVSFWTAVQSSPTFAECLKKLKAGWRLSAGTSPSGAAFNLHLARADAEKLPVSERLNYSLTFQIGSKLMNESLHLEKELNFKCGNFWVEQTTYAYGAPDAKQIRDELLNLGRRIAWRR